MHDISSYVYPEGGFAAETSHPSTHIERDTAVHLISNNSIWSAEGDTRGKKESGIFHFNVTRQ